MSQIYGDWALAAIPDGQPRNNFSTSLVSGKWEFFRMIYHGQEMEPINPKLHLYFDFTDSHVSRLYYFRDDESGFCERLALYEFITEQSTIYQKISWVNPNNQGSCSQDPDMIFGRESWAPVSLRDGNLAIEMPLSDDSLIMLWRPIPEIPVRP